MGVSVGSQGEVGGAMVLVGVGDGVGVWVAVGTSVSVGVGVLEGCRVAMGVFVGIYSYTTKLPSNTMMVTSSSRTSNTRMVPT